MSQNALLGRVLTDPATGLPNLPYFKIVRDWEERRAHRREYMVRVLRVSVAGGDERACRALGWYLCRDLRGSDLIASETAKRFHILLTSPDAENAATIADRIEAMADVLNTRHPAARPLTLSVQVESEFRGGDGVGPCEPCAVADDDEDPPPAA